LGGGVSTGLGENSCLLPWWKIHLAG